MASPSQGDDQNDTASSQPQTEEATATKRQRLTTYTGTLTSPLPSISSSSGPPCDSLNAPSLLTLPFDLVTEILYRLPVKFLLQLKCVCKSWNSLISDPKFAKKHLHVSTTHHQLIFTDVNPSHELTLTTYPLSSIFTAATAALMQLKYPLDKRDRYNYRVGSCDGILCIAIDEDFALLINPSIRKFKKLPKMKNPRERFSFTLYSFGYDHVSDDYKVVAIFCYKSDNSGGDRFYKTVVRVYTLSTNCWRRIQDFPFGDPFHESGKFVSGRVNWLASFRSSSSSWSEVIVSLDLGNESYEEILQPDYGEVIVVSLTLGVLRDCLCILSQSQTSYDVWIMKEYGNKESWTKLFSDPYLDHPIFYAHVKALYATEDGLVLLGGGQSELILYDSKKLTFTTPEIQNINTWKVVEVYIESLVSPCF